MSRLILAGCLLAVSAARLPADDPEKKGPPADKLLAEGLAKAKQDGTRVFLVFGSPSCGWCRYLEKFHAEPDVAKLLAKHIVIVKVDVVTNPGGEELYKKHGGDRGVPAWTLLDADGKTLADSGDGKDNVGFPYEPNEIDHYAAAMKKACPKLTDADVELLKKKLKEIGPKKEKDK